MSRNFVVPASWKRLLQETPEPGLVVEMQGCFLVQQNQSADFLRNRERAEAQTGNSRWDQNWEAESCVCMAWGAPEAYAAEYCPFESDYNELTSGSSPKVRVSPAAFHFHHANGLRRYRLGAAESQRIDDEAAMFIRLHLLEREGNELVIRDAGERRSWRTPQGVLVSLPGALQWSFGGKAGWEEKQEAVPEDDRLLEPVLSTLGALAVVKRRLQEERESPPVWEWVAKEGEEFRRCIPAALQSELQRGDSSVDSISRMITYLTAHPVDAMMLHEIIYGQIVEAIRNDDAERLAKPLAKETLLARRAYREVRHLFRYGSDDGERPGVRVPAEEEISRLLGTAEVGLQLLGVRELRELDSSLAASSEGELRRMILKRVNREAEAGQIEFLRDIVSRLDQLHRRRLQELSLSS